MLLPILITEFVSYRELNQSRGLIKYITGQGCHTVYHELIIHIANVTFIAQGKILCLTSIYFLFKITKLRKSGK